MNKILSQQLSDHYFLNTFVYFMGKQNEILYLLQEALHEIERKFLKRCQRKLLKDYTILFKYSGPGARADKPLKDDSLIGS